MCLGFRYIWRHILHPGAAGEPPKIPSAWWKVPLRTLALLAVFPAPWEKARSHISLFSGRRIPWYNFNYYRAIIIYNVPQQGQTAR